LKTYTPDRFCTKDEKGNIEESYARYAWHVCLDICVW
jgi:hypothetical protein